MTCSSTLISFFAARNVVTISYSDLRYWLLCIYENSAREKAKYEIEIRLCFWFYEKPNQSTKFEYTSSIDKDREI